MPGLHARLGPSDAARWISCPAAISMDDALPVVEGEDDSKYAQEGTCAHALAEIKLARHFGLISHHEADLRLRKWEREWEPVLLVDPDRLPEMHRHTDSLVIYVSQIVHDLPGAIVRLEVRLFTGIPGCWGTGDVVIYTTKVVHVIDLKYGAGVFVPVEENPQTRLYGAGALEATDILGTVETVRMTIFQPRYLGGYVGTETMTADELRAWRDDVKPIAAEALAGSDRFGPSDKACRWCPHSGKCAAQTASIFEEPWLDDDPRLLSPLQMSSYLEKVPLLQKWLSDFEAQALHTAYSLQKKIPGWKPVRSGGRRNWTDEEAAIEALLEVGYTPADIINRKIKGLGDLEKLLGKKRFDEVLSPYLKKSEGKVSLAPDSDTRPSVTPNTEAAKTFAPITEEEDLV